ncbi:MULTISPECIES: TcmI family type II polyketide cyclase [Micromonospora]|uniref:TcmI family type II polyketide cyclase n=1 Tax=Micromonospora solifontis TaxID=2487138 RepID=A0ABX9WFG9_9ACTN|nr:MULTISPECIES: TcmI family type II polyketide cyclase [Micromonospora]NES15091.1 TcmI family type II polyketide cyclase [Micromonospora sp. PPF5-17B]NES37191.1 TcmI family type II polyketide cyclase [Micromonospora solifontis]NES56234.1 TcmI family type II polyketide cyclase [Micromonospora sp. PPF5-6]RNL98638.1 TcmI family type II polyketide cyclase [Micromonospora solifontis]
MVFRNVIVCRMVPGSEGTVGDVFGYYDRTTRPQDLGVIGRILLSHHDLYLHVIERRQDPKISGQTRGLPAFQKIAEAIGPYVTPYPRYWKNPSDSVAKEFYRWAPEDGTAPGDTTLTVVVQRIKPGAEADVARIFAESDAGPLPRELGVAARYLYSIDDVFVHLIEQDAATAEQLRHQHEQRPAFGKLIAELAPYVEPYRPESWRGPQDSVATVFYRWRAED